MNQYIKTGRPGIKVDLATVLRLRDVNKLGWSKMAEAYTTKYHISISRDTIKRRYEEAKAKQTKLMTKSIRKKNSTLQLGLWPK